ncbi:MAG TPA: AAA family ATPase, partial [Capillimicrobium sp.]
MGGPARSELVERDGECEAVDAAVEGATAAGGVLLVEGPAGIGKTQLLARVRAQSAARGFATLAARGVELERDYAFGVVHQLYVPELLRRDDAGRDALLSGAAALARPLLGIDAQPAPGDADDVGDRRFAQLHGLYWLTATLAAEAPLLVLVDDAHCADVASLRFLGFLAARIESLPVLLCVGMRPSDDPERGEALAPLVELPGAVHLALGPLSADGSASVVRDRLGERATAPLCAATHRATGGNPLLLGELLDEIARADGSAEEIEQQVLQLRPPAVSRSVLRRIAALPESARTVAGALAVLGDDPTLALLGAYAGLDHGELDEGLRALAGAHVLAEEDELRFAHPIVRTVVYGSLSRVERADGHLRAAGLLMDAGADPQQVAAHILHCEPRGKDAHVQQLRTAAVSARALGAPEAAVRYLNRALEEPPRAEQRPELLLELGLAEHQSGRPMAVEHLRAAMSEADEPELRTRVGAALARALVWAGRAREAHDVLLRVIGELDREHGRRSLRLEAQLRANAHVSGVLGYDEVQRLPGLLSFEEVERLRRAP